MSAYRPRRQVASQRLAPQWNRALGELYFAGELIKRFRQPAPLQFAILDAFEVEGWPPRIDDPLPPRRGCRPQVRLHDTIKNLNRARRSARLSFHGDGQGLGVRWLARPPESSSAGRRSDPRATPAR